MSEKYAAKVEEEEDQKTAQANAEKEDVPLDQAQKDGELVDLLEEYMINSI